MQFAFEDGSPDFYILELHGVDDENISENVDTGESAVGLGVRSSWENLAGIAAFITFTAGP